MMTNLASARHELSTTTIEQLDSFNEKLEQNVSVIPSLPSTTTTTKKRTANKTEDGDEEGEDAESITSDPTELWHRDVATQTISEEEGLGLNSTNPNESEEKTKKNDPLKTVSEHEQRIKTLATRLREYQGVESDSIKNENGTRNRIVDLHSYLDALTYGSQSSRGYGYGIFNTVNIDGSTTSSTAGIPKSEEDAISNFRSEIRGFKGALLSARNFPAGSTARRVTGR